MANSTLTPNTQEEQDAYNDPELVRRGIGDAEKQRLSDIAATDQMESQFQNPSADVREREKSVEQTEPDNLVNYQNTGGKKQGKEKRVAAGGALSSAQNPMTAIMNLRRAGPIGLLVGIVLGIAALIGGSYSLLPVHLYENFLSKYDSANTSYTIRTNKMIANKLTNDATKGICLDTASILCRFQRPSNFMLKQMADNGITPIGKDGKPIEKTIIGWPNQRPASYQFTDSSGTELNVTADKLRSTLSGNDDFRAAFHQALKTRLQLFSDSIFKSVAGEFGFTKKNTAGEATSEQGVTEDIEGQTTGESTGDGTDTGTVKTGAGEEEIQDDISKKATDAGNKLAKSGAGNAVGLIAGGVCLIGDVPGIVTSAARAYQIAQLVRFGALFMTTVSALKAGDATQDQVSTFASALTTVYAGKSALDSFGIKYSLFGDTVPAKDSNYLNYVPGGKVSSVLGGITNVLNSTQKQQICAAATSPITGGVIDAVTSETIIGPVINVVAGIGISAGISVIASNLVPLIIHAIPSSVYEELGKVAFGSILIGLIPGDTTTGSTGGDITSQFGDATASGATYKAMGGQNFGDALSSGVANTLGQLANGGGNVPLSVDDAVAYDQQTQAVNLAYAKEDQATLSPLDASSPNTMMGAIFEKLMPLYAQMGSLTSFLSSFGNLATSSVGGLVMGNSYAATDTSAQYKLCKDPGVTNIAGDSVAAGPFCNIQYGIPTKYLDMDPQTIVQDLVSAGQIDPDTGEASPNAPLYDLGNAVAGAVGVSATNKTKTGVTFATASNITNTSVTEADDASGGTTSYADWLSMCTDGSTDQAINCKITNKQTAEYAIYTIDHRIQRDIDNQDIQPTGTPTTVDPSNVVVGTGGDSNTTCATPTASDGISYADLSGTNFSNKINASGTSKYAILPAGSYTFSDFAFGKQGLSGTGAQGANAEGADIKTSKGILGSGSSCTTISMIPGTSTKADYVPPEKASGSASARTNQLGYVYIDRPASYKIDGVKILGTEQGHLYNGLSFSSVANVDISNSTIAHVPGNDSGPPGETFELNLYNLPSGGTANFTNVTTDGSKVAAVGIGLNSIHGTVTMKNVLTENTAYSAGIAGWQMAGTDNYYGWVSTNNVRNYNAERHSGTTNFYDPVWDQPETNHSDINYTWESGWVGGSINFYFSNAAAWQKFQSVRTSQKKITIVTNPHGQGDIRSTVHIYVGGQLQTTSDYVSFTGAAS